MPWKYPLVRYGALAARGIAAGAGGAWIRRRFARSAPRLKNNYGRRTGLYVMRRKSNLNTRSRGWDSAVWGRLMPPWQFKTFTWVMDDALMTAATAGIIGTENDYRMNDLFAPNATSVTTGANHNAYGHDQMILFYNKYMVYKVRLTLVIYTADNTQVVAAVTHIGPPGDSQSIATKPSYQVEEWPGSQVIRLAPAGEHRWEMSKDFDMRQICGGSRQFDETEFGASFGASPTNFPVFRIGMANLTSTDQIQVRYTIKLEMWTKIYERKTLAISS